MMHIIKERTRSYEAGDFYLYSIKCSCGAKIEGWTPNWAEEGWVKHKQAAEKAGEKQ